MNSAVLPTPTFAWRKALLALAAVELILLALFSDTAQAMVGIWWRSETFNHAFLVPPITLWLIWEKRHFLARHVPQPLPWLAIPFAGLALAWLLGEMVAVNVVTQFALVAMLVLAVPMLIGAAATKEIVFPLAFLFFAVPFGEFVMPTLMEWTATFTVLGLRATGIPVYQEGLHFVIPSGRWSVVEACSGVRYLIASIVVGTLYAYLNYTSLMRRLLFVSVAILVPLAANWVRAYIIVMLGHLSGNELATGADHLIYGWVFFGIVMLIMFAIGLRWREAETTLPPLTTNESARLEAVHPPWPMLATILVLLLAIAPRSVLWTIESGPQLPAPRLDSGTLVAAGWQQESMPLTPWQPAYGNPSAILDTAFTRGGQRVGVFIAYYRQQNHERKLISSSNALVKSADKQWAQIGQGTQPVSISGQSVQMRTATLRNLAAEAQRYQIWHAYWIGGRWVASDIQGKLWLAWHKLSGQGDDSAAVFVYATESQANQALPAFLAEAGGALERLMLAAQAQR